MNWKPFCYLLFLNINVLHWFSIVQANGVPYFSEINDPGGSLQVFENQYYKFTTTSRNLFISDQVNSDSNLSEVFPSRHVSSDEYLLFIASHNSPRLNYYFDPDDQSLNGLLEVIPYQEEGPLVSDDLSMDDFFGYGITFNDWNETLVSSPSDNNGNGSIYVFELNSSNQFKQKSKMEPVSGDEGWWGNSILALEDYLFVGAPNSNSWSGEVVVFQRINGIYEKQQKISDPVSGVMHSFGNSISVGTSKSKIAVSPNVEGSDRIGRVEIFQMDDQQNWTHGQSLWSDNNVSENYFGIDHAQSENFLIIGAPGENEGQGGRAYIYGKDSNGNWVTNPTQLSSASLSPNDQFGYTVEITENFAFVGARQGDGNVSDSGVVYIFTNQDTSWVETAKLIPPAGDGNQIFSVSMEALDDLIIVGSIGVGSEGMAYVYKMHDQNASDWRLISALDNNGSSTANRNFLSIGAKAGMIAIGSPEDSLSHPFAGSFKVFFNEGWQQQNPISMDPLFMTEPPAQLSIMEDSASGAFYNFEVVHPFENNFTWNVSSINAFANTFSISSDGNFSYLPEGNFSGVVNFTLESQSSSGSIRHEFDVNVSAQPDSPIFLATQAEDLEPVWVGESFSQTIQVFDADGDSMIITASGAPAGISISGNQLIGEITDDSLFNGEAYLDFAISMTVTDGTGTPTSTKTFNLKVYSRNSPPLFVNQEGITINSLDVTLEEDFNESRWKEAVGEIFFQDDNTQTGFTLSEILSPINGNVQLTADGSPFSVIYSSTSNFNGSDSFSIQLDDTSFPTKSAVLPFNVTITPVNDPPQITSPLDVTWTEGIPSSYNIIWTDIDGDSSHIVGVANLPSWITYDSNTNSLTGVPNWSDYKVVPDEVTISVTDSGNLFDSEVLKIRVVPLNYPPVFDYEDNVTQKMQEDTMLSLVFPFYDLDGLNDSTRVNILTDAVHGDVELAVSGSEIAFKYSPDGNYSGTDFVKIEIYDPNDLNASDTLSIPLEILSVDDYPIIQTQPRYTDAVIGYEWIYEFNGVDGDANQTARIISPVLDSWVAYESDPDGNSSKGILKGTPNLIHLGLEELKLEVEDETGLLGTQNITVTVLRENFVPVINEGDSLKIEMVEDSYWEKINPLSSYDENKQRLSWSILTEPAFGSLTVSSDDENLTYLKYIPKENYYGSDQAVIQLSDGIDLDYFTYHFSILNVDDVPRFLSPHDGVHLIFEDGDQVEEVISFADGDGDIIKYEIVTKPEWLALDESNFSNGQLILSGIPLVENEGNSSVELAVIDSKNNRSAISFRLDVVVHNYPPKLLLKDQNLTLNEDDQSVRIGKITVEDKDQINGHNLLMVEEPKHGSLEIVQSEESWDLYYEPDENFHGTEQILLKVDDSGTELGLPKNDQISFNIEINSVEDVPFFSSIPPKQVYEDEGMSYLFKSVDGDFPNEELKISVTAAPDWIDLSDFGGGNGLLVGKPRYTDAGFHQVDLKVADRNGSTNTQSFFLEVVVRDFPPVFQSQKTGIILDKVTIYVKEDQILQKWINPQGFIAINPDPEPEDYSAISWSVGEDSKIGSVVSVSGSGERPSSFFYSPPENFAGTDTFSLIMDEGDRKSEIAFEIFVSEVHDPPEFVTALQSTYLVNEGESLDLEITAFDIDSDNLQFRLIGPSWEKEPWLRLIQDSGNKKANLRGIPKVGSDGKIFPYSVFLIDDTGLIVSKSLTFEVNGANSPPIILPNEIEILFNQEGEPISDYAAMIASDLEGDSLTWGILLGKDAEGNEMKLITTKGNLPAIRFYPSTLRDHYGPYSLEVSDGLNQDSISVRAKVNWTGDITVSGFEPFVVIKETQAFSQVLNLNAENFLALPKVRLIDAPEWVELKQIDNTRFVIEGISPIGSAGNYAINLDVLGEGIESQNINFKLEIIDPRIPSIKLSGDLIHRISSLEPFMDPGFSSVDARGEDLTEEVKVQNSLTDANGFQEITYSVKDEFQNEARSKRIVRHYSESPVVLSSQRQKLFTEGSDLIWDGNRNLAMIVSSFQKIEADGAEVERTELVGNAWITFPSDLSSDRVEVKVGGEAVQLSKIQSNASVTYILGKFFNNISLGTKRISSDFGSNLFLAAFSNTRELLWIHTMGSDYPIEKVGLSLLPDNSCLVSACYSRQLRITSSTSREELKTKAGGIFFGHYAMSGESIENSSIPIDAQTEVGKIITSATHPRPLIQMSDLGLAKMEVKFSLLDKSFKAENLVKLSSDIEISIDDTLLVNDLVYFCGEFEGSLYVNDQLVLHSKKSSGFLIAMNLMGNISWVKMLQDDAGLLLPKKLATDHWGDLIVGFEFSGTIKTDLNSLSSVGENDLLLMLLDAGDGGTLWEKSFGGEGDDFIHFLKVNSYGSVALGFATALGLYADNYSFSKTNKDEFHLVRLLPKTGLPRIEEDKLELREIGHFSRTLTGIHPEYLFFDLISGPSWLSLTEDDAKQGKSLLLGSTDKFVNSDFENDFEFTVGVFTMDGGFAEKTISGHFMVDQETKEELGLFPASKEPFFPQVDGMLEIIKMVKHPGTGWLLAGRFDASNTNKRSFLSKVFHFSDTYELTELISISSVNPFNLSGLEIDHKESFFLYGNFSESVKIGSDTLYARGKTDLFLAEINLQHEKQGEILKKIRYGSDNSERAGQILLAGDRIFICGTFENSLTLGNQKINSVNSSFDGFVAELDRANFYNVSWSKPFGYFGHDQVVSVKTWLQGQVIVGLIGEGGIEQSSFSVNGNPKMFFQLLRLDHTGEKLSDICFLSTGRINEGMISKLPSMNECVLAIEFEGELIWANGVVKSRGGFDIFSTKINDFFQPENKFSQLGGPWNDRLTDLKSINSSRYLISSKFYQSIQLDEKIIYSLGSSDGLVTKHDLDNHRLLDHYHLGSTGTDEVVTVVPDSEKFLLIAGKTHNQALKSSHLFIQTFGNKPSQPALQSQANKALDSSMPFEFILQTNFWKKRNGDFFLEDLGEEQSYSWLDIGVDGEGNLKLSGIAPASEAKIPLDFTLIEGDYNESLRIQFFLDIREIGNHTPVLRIPEELNVEQNQELDLNFGFFDFDGDTVSLAMVGPSWISIQNIGEENASLSVARNSSLGEHKVKVFATDPFGKTAESQVKVIVHAIENEKVEQEEMDSNSSRSWIENRIDLENGWSYHLDFGWIYLREDPNGSVWIWKEGWGWLWSESKLWNDKGEGYFYVESNSSWIFWSPQPTQSGYNIYDFSTEDWKQL